MILLLFLSTLTLQGIVLLDLHISPYALGREVGSCVLSLADAPYLWLWLIVAVTLKAKRMIFKASFSLEALVSASDALKMENNIGLAD